MTEIYHQARQVIVWLGPGDASSDLVMGQVDKVGKTAMDSGVMEFEESELTSWPNFGIDDHGKHLDGIKASLEKLMPKMSKGDSDGVPFPLNEFADLMRREWFEHIWVLQELAIARDVMIASAGQTLEIFSGKGLGSIQTMDETWDSILTVYDAGPSFQSSIDYDFGNATKISAGWAAYITENVPRAFLHA
jgi:hypothetical protein